MKWFIASLVSVYISLFSLNALSEDVFPAVEVVEAYLDLRTGPGRGYPLFYIAERGEWVEVIKRRTDWIKVRTERGKEGWIHFTQLEKTIKASRQPVVFKQQSFAGYLERRYELGFLAGTYDTRYDLLSVYGAYRFTDQLSLELHVQQMLLESTIDAVSVNLLHEPFTYFKTTPYFGIGLGRVKVDESSVDLSAAGTSDRTVHVAAGLRHYVTRNFLCRLGYRRTVQLTRKNDNDETEEWKLGFAVFF